MCRDAVSSLSLCSNSIRGVNSFLYQFINNADRGKTSPYFTAHCNSVTSIGFRFRIRSVKDKFSAAGDQLDLLFSISRT